MDNKKKNNAEANLKNANRTEFANDMTDCNNTPNNNTSNNTKSKNNK